MSECLQCGKETKNKFCSKSHSAIYNNRKRGYKVPAKNCIRCGNELRKGYKSSGRKYCSSKCSALHKTDLMVKRWLEGETDGSQGDYKQSLSHAIRNYLLREVDYKCSQCGWGEVNVTTGKTPLEIDHIDGHPENNMPNNLRVLCPNCHSLTSHHGILNKGNGRRRYRELYLRSQGSTR